MSDLDPVSYLKLQRRLCRYFKTDEAVAKIYQLMRVPGTKNTKDPDNIKLCEIVDFSDKTYTCEELDSALPPLTLDDERYCTEHYNKTYNLKGDTTAVDEKLPDKFMHLIANHKEIKKIWAGSPDDRSKSDYRLGHLLFGNGFTREEARSVLVNSAKASERLPKHRISYADGIIDKIWTYELQGDNNSLDLSESVLEILNKGETAVKGQRFEGPRYLDATEHGFRLGQVIGLVAGSGVGKTAIALNMFWEFVKKNPDYIHFFVPLEQPSNEIADRWRSICGDNPHLHEKVHVISNYATDGSFRHLTLSEIKDYILKFQRVTGKKAGCVVIDHIGALKKKGEDGENQGIMDICHEMKAFAVQTNTLLVMQSQSSREKAGIGDLELNKDAAYGTVYFESYCDYLITIWQPLKRCYNEEGCPTITAFKFCKIRHKRVNEDEIKEDVCYRLYFDSKTERLRPLTQIDETAFEYWIAQATNIRKKDRKTDLVPYKSTAWMEGDSDGEATDNKDATRAS
jgi:KaiC/GvpD/RAD55 family RecA-like ATPase